MNMHHSRHSASPSSAMSERPVGLCGTGSSGLQKLPGRCAAPWCTASPVGNGGSGVAQLYVAKRMPACAVAGVPPISREGFAD